MKHCSELCIKARSFITWTFPLGFSMEDHDELTEFNIQRSLLKGFLEQLNWYTEKVTISAILYSIDDTVFLDIQNNLKRKGEKNALYLRDLKLIKEAITKESLTNKFLEDVSRKLEQNRTSLSDKLETETKKYRSEEW